MCPSIETVHLASGETDEVYVSLGVTTEDQLRSISRLMPELKDQLASRWPIKGFRFKRRNPFNPELSVTFLYIALAGGVAKAIGEKLGTEAFEWLKARVKDLGREGDKSAMGRGSARRKKRR
jgi:hypothetical protein